MASGSDILGTAGDISSILAAIEAGRANGRVGEATVNQNQGRVAGDIYRTQAGVALAGPRSSAQNAALGDTLANVQPFKWTGGTQMSGNIPIPQSTGGLTPANFGPATRKAGADLATLSADRVNSPAFNIPKPPVLAPVPSANGLDSILGAAGGIGSILGALGKGAAKGTAGGGGGIPGSGGSVDLSKLWALLHPGDPDAGSPSHQEPGDPPTAGVDTSTTFGGVPGGVPNNPEDPMAADPEWWKQFLPPDGDAGNGTGPTGTWWGDE
jgi:hypothetical protein